MTEIMLALLGIAIGVIGYAMFEVQRTRKALDQASRELRADREILGKASASNETLAGELARQRDQLAAVEMRLAGPPTRGFNPPR